jgi:hypothetical protein
MQDGQSRYAAGDWRTHSMEDHLDHAGAHLEDLLNTEELTEEKLRTGLSHLICRAVMAWARREKNDERFRAKRGLSAILLYQRFSVQVSG